MVFKTSAHPNVDAERAWLADLARRIARVIAGHGWQSLTFPLDATRQELDLAVAAVICTAESDALSYELWIDTIENESRQLSFWFASHSVTRIERLAESGNRLFPRYAIQHDEFNALQPNLNRIEGETSFYGVFLPYSVRPERRPAGLLVTDIAYFFDRVYAADLALSRDASPRGYHGQAPGLLLRPPGSSSVLSQYQCPDCQRPLLSCDEQCADCRWAIGRRSASQSESPYDYDLADT